MKPACALLGIVAAGLVFAAGQTSAWTDVATPDGSAETAAIAPGAPAAAPEAPRFDQAEVVRQQRERLEGIKKELQVVLRAGESDHFLLFSDLQTQVRDAILVWLEDLRKKVITTLSVDPQERFWDGKCLVLVFERQESLQAFAEKFDDHHVPRPRGYFVLEARRSDGPRLVHIATFQPLKGGNEALREVLVHETTHAIIEMCGKSGTLPLWVHEGLAEYMTCAMDPSLRPRKQKHAYEAASATPYESIQDVLTGSFPPSDLRSYSVSMGLIECLLKIDADGVLKFVEALKDGMPPHEALAQAYLGLDYEGLERRWKDYVLRAYRPPSQDVRP